MANQTNPVIREILRQGRRLPKNVRDRYIAAALETGRIESNFQNVAHGDADSVNWRQERASIYGGDMSIRRSVARFYKEAADLDRGQPSYQLAADVQRPAEQYRGRYRTAQPEALSILKSAGPSPVTTTTIPGTPGTPGTPGVDKSAERRALVANFLQTGGVANPQAVLTLAGQYGKAADIPGTPGTPGTPARTVTTGSKPRTGGKGGSKVLELIYNDGGKGYGIKNGQVVNGPSVYSAVWAGHQNHVHVAAGPKTVVRLGRLAQQMGLSVGENPHFGGVDPVHVPGSYHYRGEAIDVSGDPAKMKAFARRVEQYNRNRKL